MSTKQELYLPRVKPRWETLEDLVRALGCRMKRIQGPYYHHEFLVGNNGRGRTVLGSPPDSRCALAKDGRIYHSAAAKVIVNDAFHEALHWRLGPWSFRSETAMMPVEVDLARRIGDDKQRRAYLHLLRGWALPIFASDYHLDTIGDLVDEYKADWARARQWRTCVSASRKRGYRLDGRLPRAHRWKGHEYE